MRTSNDILQAIAAGDLEQAFDMAREYLQTNMPGLLRQLTSLESAYRSGKREYLLNKVPIEAFTRHVARTSDALYELIMPPGAEGGPALNSGYHALTCDREVQTAKFEQVFKERRENGEQIQFYYLYGGRYQSHESLSKRLAQERSGMRRGLSLQATARIGTGAVQFDVCEDLECSKIEFIAGLCEAFGMNPNAYSDLKSKRLDFLLQESSVLRGLRAEDFALCFIEVSEWDNQLVPAIAEWFVKEFCQGVMPSNTPTCLFFFGVNYRETDDRTPREIEVALRNAQHTVGLPELQMIEEADLEDWIRHYARPLGIANNSARDALLDDILQKVRIKQQNSPRKQVPGKEHLLHMDDVETELKRVIDQKNE